MKYLQILLISFVLLFISCNESTKPEITDEYKEPAGNYIFDIKTKFIEKKNITGAKNGTISYLENGKWSKVEYTGEDYSVWIKNAYRNNIDDSTISLAFDYELHTPAMFTEGELIIGKTIKIEYVLNNDWIGQTGNPNAEDVQRLYEIYCQKMEMTKKLLPYARKIAKYSKPEFSKLIDAIFDLIDLLMPDENSMYQKAEAVIVGSECYGQLSEWISEMENGGIYYYQRNYEVRR